MLRNGTECWTLAQAPVSFVELNEVFWVLFKPSPDDLSGIWAIDIADEHPQATVIGTDLVSQKRLPTHIIIWLKTQLLTTAQSAIQPGWVPPNCKFYIDDAEGSWSFDKPFDLIHGRALNAAFVDWPQFYKQALDNLEPGGMIEMQDFQFWIFQHEDFKSLPDPIEEYLTKTRQAFSAFGKNIEVAISHKQWMEDAGFVDVEEAIMQVPMGNWAKGKEMKQLGMYHLAQSLDAVDAYSLQLYTQVLGLGVEETVAELEKVKKEMADKSNRLYGKYYCVMGRKPRQ